MVRDAFAVAGVALAVWGGLRLRDDLGATFAWLAVVSRLWTYHRAYDDVILAFLVFEMYRRFLQRPTGRAVSLLLIAGLSLWLPYSLYVSTAGSWIQTIAWIVVASSLFRLGHSPQPPVGQEAAIQRSDAGLHTPAIP